MHRGSIGRGGVKYNKCKWHAVLQRGELILGTRRCGPLVTKLFAALGLRDTEDCHDTYSTIVEVTTIAIVMIPQIIVVFRTNCGIQN